jgi:hypothetical protein
MKVRVLDQVLLTFTTSPDGYMAPEQLKAHIMGRLDDAATKWHGAVVDGKRVGRGMIDFGNGDYQEAQYEAEWNGKPCVHTSPIVRQIVGKAGEDDIFVTASGTKYQIASVRETLPDENDPTYIPKIQQKYLRPELIYRGPDGFLVREGGLDPWWKISDFEGHHTSLQNEAAEAGKGQRCKGTGSSQRRFPRDPPPPRASIRRSNRMIGKKKLAK